MLRGIRTRYQAFYPIFTDRIHVTGIQHAEPISPSSCRLVCKVRIQVSIPLIGGTAERAIEQLMKAAYAEMPKKALEYATLRGLVVGGLTAGTYAESSVTPSSSAQRAPPAMDGGVLHEPSGSSGALEATAAFADSSDAAADGAGASPAQTCQPLSSALVRCVGGGGDKGQSPPTGAESREDAPIEREWQESLSLWLTPSLSSRLGEGVRAEAAAARLLEELHSVRTQLALRDAELHKAKENAAKLTDELHSTSARTSMRLPLPPPAIAGRRFALHPAHPFASRW